MIYQEILQIVRLVAREKITRNIAVLVTLFCLLVTVFYSSITALVIYIAYIAGYIFAWLLIRYQKKTGFFVQRLNSFCRDRFLIKKSLPHSCSVCDNLSCRRHQQSASLTPWKHLYISKDLDASIESFYERIINNFINSWYRNITDDTDFINELRHCLRYASATIVNRLLEIDIADTIANKLVPCAVKHVDDYLYMRQIGKLKNTRFNEVIVEYLGKRLHVAATNRKNEISYLQHLVSALLTHILPDNYLKCRNYSVMIREILSGWVFLPLMDVLADPNIINSLVILACTYKAKKTVKTNKLETVEFLYNYNNVDKRNSSFATNLNKIKNNIDLLNALMQFLKKHDHDNLLQFCLDVDEFNTRLLTPDLSVKQLDGLYIDIVKLYKEYLDKDSYNFISCPSGISNDFKIIIQESLSLDKLRRLSKLLYKAYDVTFAILESFWLPQFFHSNEFYAHICGSKVVSTYNKQSVNNKAKKYYDPSMQSAVAKLSTGIGKIRGALKTTQTVEGAFYSMEPQSVDNGMVEDILLGDCKTLFRDLSTWHVTIPSYQASPSNKVIYFYINVERTDVHSDDATKKNWIVLRKDQDFYTLKAKLVEFHGESEICDSPLPSRKLGSAVDSRMSKYEDFLQRLLRKPTLRGSDLLYAFLTTEEDFTIYIATNASNIQDIGNIYQSVAYKLRKEKGQHLDSFMTSLLNSVREPRNDKLEWAEVGEAFETLESKSGVNVPLPKTNRNHIFNDNFGVQYKSLKGTMSGSFNPECFVECIFYLLKHIFKAPDICLRLYAAICSVAENLVDLISRLIIDHKLKSGLCQSNMAYLIKLLENVVFMGHIPPTKDELEKRKIRAFHELDNAMPAFLKRTLGLGVNDGCRTLLEILQHPHYNKQLAYNLLDIVLLELYPMLEKNEDYY